MTTQLPLPIQIQQTQAWLQQFVIQYNICPFAKYPHEQQRIHYQMAENDDMEACLMATVLECERLSHNPAIETTLLIFAQGFESFDDFLDLLYTAEELLHAQGYEGIYQLASFHPQYLFAEATADDPANYTNRSPYPMLHIIREASLAVALASYPAPEDIPENNIVRTRQLGITHLRQLLTNCMRPNA